MKRMILLTAMLCAVGCVTEKKEPTMKSLYDIEVTRITGESLLLNEYKGSVMLIVNTASRCGFTSQYDGLQKLYQTYEDRGLVVLGFPSNDFLKQEPGNNEEILTFCRNNYGVTFPMFEKVHVKGSDSHPLYTFLTEEETNPLHAGNISWNFNKFLIGRDGTVLARFGSRTKPEDSTLIRAVEEALQP